MGQKLKIWHITDNHGYHNLLNRPNDLDIVIFSGDSTNWYDKEKNYTEFVAFLNWFKQLDIKYKILIAGNHDATLFHNTLSIKKEISDLGIIYLENDYTTIEGLKIFGSPITPTFGNWYFNKQRGKLDNLWKLVDEDIDIMITHGPPKGILDLSYDRNGKLEFCGDNSLRNHVINRIKPKLHLYGHIHNVKDIVNAGVLYRDGIYFSNAAAVEDGRFGKIVYHGSLFEIDEDKNIKII